MSVYVEVTGFGKEFGSVEVHEDGSATIRTGTSPHGQGHETAFAQLASGVLRIPFDKITVLHSDTSLLPRGDGTMGSRSLQLGGSADPPGGRGGRREGASSRRTCWRRAPPMSS